MDDILCVITGVLITLRCFNFFVTVDCGIHVFCFQYPILWYDLNMEITVFMIIFIVATDVNIIILLMSDMFRLMLQLYE
jgi:hypothetical protein